MKNFYCNCSLHFLKWSTFYILFYLPYILFLTQVIFEGTMSTGTNYYMAIDDISATMGPCGAAGNKIYPEQTLNLKLPKH
jgi:hypothetical protein